MTATPRPPEEPTARASPPLLRLSIPGIEEMLTRVGDAVLTVDNANRVTFMNAAAERQYGVRADAVIGQPLSSIYRYRWTDPTDQASAIRSLDERGEWSGENVHVTLDGRELQVEVRVKVLRDTHGARSGLLAEIRNVTELRQIEARLRDREQALRDTEERHRLLADTMLHGVVHQGADGRIIDMNRAAQRILGKSRERFLGSNSELEETHTIREDGSIFRGADHPSMVALRTGRTVRGAIMGVFNPEMQEWRWLSVDGVPVFRGDEKQPSEVYGVFEDITERKQADAALLHAKALSDAMNRINEVVHSTMDFTAIAQGVLSEGSAALRCDSAAISMRLQGGWMVSQLHGMAPDVVGTRMTDEQECHAKLAIQRREVVAIESAADDPRCNNEHLRSHGIQSVLVAPLIIRNEPFGVVFFNYQRATHVFTNAESNFARQLAATASVALENARLFIGLQQSAAALREADERKDVFLATLAHELRNPLAPIRTAAHLLESAPLSSEALSFSRGVITRQVAQMAHLLDDLLDIARVSRGALALKMRAVDLKTIVDAAVESARPQIDGKQHALDIQLPQEAVIVQADPIRLTQILTNLLTNAAKYTPARGQIVLGARVEPQRLSLFVRDTGIGIAAPMLSKVFTMFVQANESEPSADGGLGIGLALVKGLVDLHGGGIEARSQGPGRGSEFIVSLPHAGISGASSAPEPVVADRIASSPRRILIADDNRDGVESLAMLLQLSGHEVFVAHSGLEAWESCERLRPDVAVLDIGMGALNGYEVAKRIRAQPWGATMRLIAMTGWGREDDKRAAHEAGIDHHLTKPVDLPELDRLVGADLATRRD